MLKNSSIKSFILFMAAIVLLFLACANSNKKYADEYYAQGLVFYKSMEYDRSIDDFTKALEINPKDEENHKVYYMRGRSYLENRQYDQAINDFTKALEICPETDKATRFSIMESRGNSYHALNKNDAAIKDFSDAIALNLEHKNMKYVYNNRGWVWQNKEDYQKALKDYYAALAIDPAFAPAYFGRASSWYKLGNLPRALEDAKEALRLEPESKKYDDLLFELRSKMKQ
ncbi:MAG: tetratricopeptide repeat protein [Desulfobacterales bacterium]|nr:tetratricopeptide repeat protein [Desulfobacterales bacterium]